MDTALPQKFPFILDRKLSWHRKSDLHILCSLLFYQNIFERQLMTGNYDISLQKYFDIVNS